MMPSAVETILLREVQFRTAADPAEMLEFDVIAPPEFMVKTRVPLAKKARSSPVKPLGVLRANPVPAVLNVVTAAAPLGSKYKKGNVVVALPVLVSIVPFISTLAVESAPFPLNVIVCATV